MGLQKNVLQSLHRKYNFVCLFIFSVIKLSIKFEEIILNLNAALFWQTFGVFSLLDLDPHGGCGSGSERHPIMRIRILTSAINESFQGCQLKDKN